MGMSCFSKHSYDNCINSNTLPNPNPNNWELLHCAKYPNATVLKVRYTGCTNFEGIKVLVYLGNFDPPKYLDPHFEDTYNSPIARFKPDNYGWILANTFASHL